MGLKKRDMGFAIVSKHAGVIGKRPTELQARLRGALQESLEEGRDEMRRLIGQRGARARWVANWDNWEHAKRGRRGSAPGRVASGNMQNSATFEMMNSSKMRFRGRVGWLGRLGENKYFMAQENGIKVHNITGQEVEGMHVLADVARFVDDRYAERSERIVRDILDQGL